MLMSKVTRYVITFSIGYRIKGETITKFYSMTREKVVLSVFDYNVYFRS